MATAGEIERIVLADDKGEYYLITRDMLEQARVTGDQKREVEQLVGGGSDVSGFALTSGGLQASPGINNFGSDLRLAGACACSFAGCSTYDRSQTLIR